MFPTHLRGDSSNSPQNFRGSSKKTSSSKNKIDAKQPSNGGIGRVKTHKKGDQASNGSSLLTGKEYRSFDSDHKQTTINSLRPNSKKAVGSGTQLKHLRSILEGFKNDIESKRKSRIKSKKVNLENQNSSNQNPVVTEQKPNSNNSIDISPAQRRPNNSMTSGKSNPISASQTARRNKKISYLEYAKSSTRVPSTSKMSSKNKSGKGMKVRKHTANSSPQFHETLNIYKGVSVRNKRNAFKQKNTKTKNENERPTRVASKKKIKVPFVDESVITEEFIQKPEIKEEQDSQHKPNNSHKLSDFVTQVKPGVNPIASIEMGRRGAVRSHNNSQDQTGRSKHHDGTTFWHAGSGKQGNFYMNTLFEALRSDLESDVFKLYREHFNQTYQSIVFLNNIEKIDECSLIEKKVYLPPNLQKKRTLILDLDETLVHCNESLEQPYDHLINIMFANGDEVEAGINIRPHVQEFLKEMSQLFEIIIFTASHSCYANVVLNILDPNNEFITYRLFRDHCLQTKEGIFIKDLRIIANRNLAHITIVDNATYSFGFQLENGIPIIPFYSDKRDNELLKLMDFLKQMNLSDDLRSFNSSYFKYDILSENWDNYDQLVQELVAP